MHGPAGGCDLRLQAQSCAEHSVDESYRNVNACDQHDGSAEDGRHVEGSEVFIRNVAADFRPGIIGSRIQTPSPVDFRIGAARRPFCSRLVVGLRQEQGEFDNHDRNTARNLHHRSDSNLGHVRHAFADDAAQPYGDGNRSIVPVVLKLKRPSCKAWPFRRREHCGPRGLALALRAGSGVKR